MKEQTARQGLETDEGKLEGSVFKFIWEIEKENVPYINPDILVNSKC